MAQTEQKELYRWLAPDRGPVSAAELAAWATSLALPATAQVYCHPRDLAALRSTLLAHQVAVPKLGAPQAGTLWVALT